MRNEVLLLREGKYDKNSFTFLLYEVKYFSGIIGIRVIDRVKIEKGFRSKQDFISKIIEIYLIMYNFYPILFSVQFSTLIFSFPEKEIINV